MMFFNLLQIDKKKSKSSEKNTKDSNAAAALSLWFFHFLGFLAIAFFPVYHSDRSFLSFLVVNVVVNMLPVHFY